MGSPWVNLGIYVALCAALPGVPGVIMAISRRVKAHRRQPVPEPGHPPIERIAADLRRLADCARTLPAGTTFVRHRALEMAYDDVLLQACRALEITTELADLTGWERDIERLRVEACLLDCGLPIR